MGIFNFFKKKTEIDTAPSLEFSIPTVKVDATQFSAYDEIFLSEMATIKAFSSEEIHAMLDLISSGEGGFLNQGRYFSSVFEGYFKGREWVWPEYEKWKNVFMELNEWPVKWIGWMRSSAIKELQNKDVLELLTIPELRELLKQLGTSAPSKFNKQTLIALALEQSTLDESISDFPALLKARDDYSNRRYFALYETLMRTIYGRARSLHDVKRQNEMGITKRKLLLAFEEDRKFADMALAENPNALLPLFPGDISYQRAVIPAFER